MYAQHKKLSSLSAACVKAKDPTAVLCLRHKRTLPRCFYQDEMPSGISWTTMLQNIGNFKRKHIVDLLPT